MNNQLVPFVPHDFGSYEELSKKSDSMSIVGAQQTREINTLGQHMGFGRMMQLAQQEWRRTLAADGMAGGEFAYGACVALTYVCGCVLNQNRTACDWCEGAGWLTKKVRELQIAAGE